MKTRDIPSTNEITTFWHCGKCLEEIKSGASGSTSPRDYARLNVGFTKLGLQVWCVRHDVNVCHVDFEGQKHPANMRIAPVPEKPSLRLVEDDGGKA